MILLSCRNWQKKEETGRDFFLVLPISQPRALAGTLVCNSIKERLNVTKERKQRGKRGKIVIARTGIRSHASKNGLAFGTDV
jgi:hypothetical protein